MTAENRSPRCPCCLTTSRSVCATGRCLSCNQLDGRSTPEAEWQRNSMSNRLSRDLVQLNSFLEDVEVRSASVRQMSRLRYSSRYADNERERVGVESSTYDRRTMEVEEQSVKVKPMKLSERTGTGHGLRLRGATLQNRGKEIDGTEGRVKRDSKDLRGINEDAGMTNVGEYVVLTNPKNEESIKLGNMTEYLREETTSAENEDIGKTENKRENIEKASIASTKIKTSLEESLENRRRSVKQKREGFSADYRPLDESRSGYGSETVSAVVAVSDVSHGSESERPSSAEELNKETDHSGGSRSGSHVLRRFFTSLRVSIKRGKSRNARSTDRKRDSVLWPWKDRDREAKATGRGVASVRSTLSRTEPDDWRDQHKRKERIQKQSNGAEDFERTNGKVAKNEEYEKERDKKEHKTMEQGREDEAETKDNNRGTNKEEAPKAERAVRETKKCHKVNDGTDDRERQGQGSDESENDGKELDCENEKAYRFKLSQRWSRMISEYAVLLTSEPDSEAACISDRQTEFQTLAAKVIQFEDDYRYLKIKKRSGKTKTKADSFKYATTYSDDDVDDFAVDETKNSGDDAQRLPVENLETVIQQHQQPTQLHPLTSPDDQLGPNTSVEDVQTPHISRSSGEHSPAKNSSDIKKARSEVTMNSRRSPTKQVTEQDREAYRDEGAADIGCTRSDKSIGRLSRSEKQRYLHGREQFETDTRAEQGASSAHGESPRIGTEITGRKAINEVEKKTKDDKVLRRIMHDNLMKEITSNADPGLVLYALRHKPSEDKTRSKLSTASSRLGRGVQAEGGPSSCRVNQHTDKQSPRVEWRHSGDSLNRHRPIKTAHPHTREAPVRRTTSSMVTSVAAAAAKVKSSPMIPTRNLHSPVSAACSAGRGAALQQLNRWKGKLKTLGMQADVSDYRSEIRSEDTVGNRRPGAEEVHSRNRTNEIKLSPRTTSYTIIPIRRIRGSDENVTHSSKGQENRTIHCKEDPERSRVTSENRPDEAAANRSKSGREAGTVLSQNEPERSSRKDPTVDALCISVRPGHFRESLSRKRETFQRSRVLQSGTSNRTTNQTTSEYGSGSPCRRRQLQDRYPSIVTYRPFMNDQNIDSSDVDSDDPDGCLKGRNLATTRSEERSQMPQRPRFPTFLSSLHGFSAAERGRQRRRFFEMVEFVRNETADREEQYEDDEVQDRAEDEEDECTFFDSLSYFEDGDSRSCEQLLAESEPDEKEVIEVVDPMPGSPVEITTYVKPQQLRMIVERPIPDNGVQSRLIRMTAPPVKQPEEQQFDFDMFRMVRSAFAGLNERLRSTDSGGLHLHDQRLMITIIVILIALLIILLVEVCPLHHLQ